MPAKKSDSADAQRVPQKKNRPASGQESKAIAELRQEVTELRTEVHWLKAQLSTRPDVSETEEPPVVCAPAEIVESGGPEMDLDALRSELLSAVGSQPESDWELPENAEDSTQDEDWQGAKADESIEYEVLQFNTAHPIAGTEESSQPSPTIEAETPVEPGVGLAMDDHEIAALIAEAEALAKAEIKAEAETDAGTTAQTADNSSDEPDEDGQVQTESESPESAITTEFLAGAPSTSGTMVSESLSVPSAEMLATVPWRLAIDALACPQSDRDGNLVFLVATPVDEVALRTLETQMGKPASLVHAKVPAVIKAFRETYPDGGIGSSPSTSGWNRIKGIFRRAA